jgi:hypothetical protein
MGAAAGVSQQALSQQLPRRLIDALTPYSASTSRKSLLAYWLPRPPWEIGPACWLGWRLNHAMRSASMTTSRFMCWRDLQPITLRLNRSVTIARSSRPSSVAMSV